MPIIRPITDLRNHSNEIIELCESENQPVFITRNGTGQMVVMSHSHYEQLQARLELYDKLAVAEAEEAAGARGIPHRTVIARIRRRIRGKAR